MFERTFSFWHRLMGRVDAAPKDQDKDERRFWIRYPADIKSNVHLNGKVAPQRVPVVVQNISQGGVQLLMDRPLEPGVMLSLELPSATEVHHEVLACVVRSKAISVGQWELGCVFSRELGQDDLEGFGARKVRHDKQDQRHWQRFPCNLTTRMQRVGGLETTALKGQMTDLSPSGVGILAAHTVEPGTLWTVELLNLAGAVVKTILACVVHVSGPEEGGQWSLGLNFIRQLQEEDLQAIVSG